MARTALCLVMIQSAIVVTVPAILIRAFVMKKHMSEYNVLLGAVCVK